MDKKIIGMDPYSSTLNELYSPSKNIELTDLNKKFEEHVNWVLKTIDLYNKTGTSNAIIFSPPPKS